MSLDFLYLRGAFRDKCDSFNFTSIEGCTEVQEGSFESPESNKQAYQKPPEVYVPLEAVQKT